MKNPEAVIPRRFVAATLATTLGLLTLGDVSQAEAPAFNSDRTQPAMIAGIAIQSSAGLAFDGNKFVETRDLSGVKAEAAGINNDCNGGNKPTVYCVWKIIGVESIPGTITHAKNFCTSFGRSPYTQHPKCEITKSKSITTTAEVSGTVHVKFVDLSARVKYDVTETNTVIAGNHFDVPKNSPPGSLYFTSVYDHRKKISQENELCYQWSPFASFKCYRATNPAPGDISYAYTEKYRDTKITGPPFAIKR